ncbi:THAP domain-containing protein 8 [Choloepus didactylus]|uniref:THAP domain-containing protein 8 n=1 Tax=Choloepus didactylus TaxID=27675 RepID=UPI0018A0D507|nr:THAP domain-containing protein 8 [Choloepus didactylus]
MPKSCRAPNCSNAAGRLGADNRPVPAEGRPPTADLAAAHRPRVLGAQLPPASVQRALHACQLPVALGCALPAARRGALHLLPGSAHQDAEETPKRVEASRFAPPPQESAPQPRDPAILAPGPMHLVVPGPPPGGPEAAATVLLAPLPLPPAPSGPRPESSSQHARLGLGAALGALQRRVRRLQRRHTRHRAQLRALEELVQQLRWEGLLARMRRGLPGLLPGPEESRAFTIICGGTDVAVVLA